MLEASPGAETRRAFTHEIVHACLVWLGSFPTWLQITPDLDRRLRE